MRTQEGFPNFGEVDDVANFEQIQRGLRCREDEWIYMNRGLGIPGRIKTLEDGTHHGAGDRRGLHARIHQGMEAADEGAAETDHSAGAVENETTALSRDPARYSYYVDDAAYRELIADFHRIRTKSRPSRILPSAIASARLLEREARLLDQLRFHRMDGELCR